MEELKDIRAILWELYRAVEAGEQSRGSVLVQIANVLRGTVTDGLKAKELLELEDRLTQLEQREQVRKAG